MRDNSMRKLPLPENVFAKTIGLHSLAIQWYLKISTGRYNLDGFGWDNDLLVVIITACWSRPGHSINQKQFFNYIHSWDTMTFNTMKENSSCSLLSNVNFLRREPAGNFME